MQNITLDTVDQPNAKKIVVLGAGGKLGSRIVNLLHNHDNLVFYGGITRDSTTYDYLNECNVVIDVSSAEGTKNLISELLSKKLTKPLVIGTTGDLPMSVIKEYAKIAPVALISNFSRGIPQLIELIHHIDSDTWDIDIEETHHIHKKDAPSGTAKTLAKEFKGARKIDISDIKSYREGEVIGEHTIILKNYLETLSITHSAKSRDIFADGAIRYASWILDKKPGLYTGMCRDKIQFSKYTGRESDFIILKGSEVSEVSKEFVKNLCCRKKSIGADGLLLVDFQCQDKIIRWTHYNSDGDLINEHIDGARCVSQYCLDNGMVNDNFILANKTSDIYTKVTYKDGTFFAVIHRANFSVLVDVTASGSAVKVYDGTIDRAM